MLWIILHALLFLSGVCFGVWLCGFLVVHHDRRRAKSLSELALSEAVAARIRRRGE